MSYKVMANLRSLQTQGNPERLDFGHHKAEVTIVSRKSDSEVVAEYGGSLYSGIFNIFAGEYFVDDVDGYIGKVEE
jgi:hypothetical protein